MEFDYSSFKAEFRRLKRLRQWEKNSYGKVVSAARKAEKERWKDVDLFWQNYVYDRSDKVGICVSIVERSALLNIHFEAKSRFAPRETIPYMEDYTVLMSITDLRELWQEVSAEGQRNPIDMPLRQMRLWHDKQRAARGIRTASGILTA